MLGVWDWVSVGMLVMGWWVIRVGTKGGWSKKTHVLGVLHIGGFPFLFSLSCLLLHDTRAATI